MTLSNKPSASATGQPTRKHEPADPLAGGIYRKMPRRSEKNEIKTPPKKRRRKKTLPLTPISAARHGRVPPSSPLAAADAVEAMGIFLGWSELERSAKMGDPGPRFRGWAVPRPRRGSELADLAASRDFFGVAAVTVTVEL